MPMPASACEDPHLDLRDISMHPRRKILILTGLALGLAMLWYAVTQETANAMRASTDAPTPVALTSFLQTVRN